MSHSDTLTIRDLKLWTHIGVLEEERKREQRILATVTLELMKQGAGESDDIKDSVDYEVIVRAIRELAKSERHTLEKFAEDIARGVLKNKSAERVTVSLRKFVLPGTEDVSLAIVRP